MKIKYLAIASSTFLLLSLSSCKKNEGLGGKSSITGKIRLIVSTIHGEAIDTTVAIDKDIFISYGKSTAYNDKVISDGEGNFNFSYLREGSYKIYAFGDCNTCSSGKRANEKFIELDKNETQEINDLYLQKIVDYDDGFATINGELKKQDYVGMMLFGSPYAAQEENVYIVYNNDSVYFDRIDSDAQGKFQFNNLIPGKYTIYALSECYSCIDNDDTVATTVIVKDWNEQQNTGTLTIENR